MNAFKFSDSRLLSNTTTAVTLTISTIAALLVISDKASAATIGATFFTTNVPGVTGGVSNLNLQTNDIIVFPGPASAVIGPITVNELTANMWEFKFPTQGLGGNMDSTMDITLGGFPAPIVSVDDIGAGNFKQQPTTGNKITTMQMTAFGSPDYKLKVTTAAVPEPTTTIVGSILALGIGAVLKKSSRKE